MLAAAWTFLFILAMTLTAVRRGGRISNTPCAPKGVYCIVNDALEYAREWLVKARRDWMSAEVLIAHPEPLCDTAAFPCQQAVEKALKVFLVYHNKPFAKGHDLRVLCRACQGIDQAFEAFCAKTDTLSRYAVRFRYPGPLDPTVKDVRDALVIVTETWDLVLDRLPAELGIR